MRPVTQKRKPARKAASRSGAPKGRTAAGRAAQPSRRSSSVAPGSRRTKAGKQFGRRDQRPPSRIATFFANIRDGRLPGKLIFLFSAVFLISAIVYGLAIGGHFAAAGAYVVAKVDAAVGVVGFEVSEVTVEGRERTTRADVLRALRVERGQSIFDVDLVSARRELMRLDWISDATVTRILPGRVHVEIVERKPYAVWQRGGELSVIDADGSPITENGVDGYGHLPFVVGHGAARRAAEFTALVAQWPELQARVRAYVRVGDRRWNLRLENGVDVLLPETDVKAALSELVALDQSHRLLARDIEAIDMRLGDRFSVRLSPDAAARRNAMVEDWENRASGDDT
ncbi:MAG: cell division protein FtsQ/DivIB [Parvibaculum sp.]